MRKGTCWAPECEKAVQRKYCSDACKQKAFRRNGGKSPSTPYPPHPLLGDPDRHLDTAPKAVVRSKPPEKKPRATTPRRGRVAAAHAETTAATFSPQHPAPAGPAPALAGGAGDPASGPGEPAPGPAVRTETVTVAYTEDGSPTVPLKVHPLVARYKADLAKINQLDTRDGLEVIQLAERLVSSATSPAAAASLSRELKARIDDLERSTPEALAGRDPSLAIRERTLAKLRGVQYAGVLP